MTEHEQPDDGQLLTAYAATGDEAAFATLVRRYTPMVQGACLRVIRDFQEAQDLTQAVFLTLARKAARLRREPALGGWLHHVATCQARNARVARQRRQRREEVFMRTATPVTPAAGRAVAWKAKAGEPKPGVCGSTRSARARQSPPAERGRRGPPHTGNPRGAAPAWVRH